MGMTTNEKQARYQARKRYLEKRVLELEARVRELEAAPSRPATRPAPHARAAARAEDLTAALETRIRTLEAELARAHAEISSLKESRPGIDPATLSMTAQQKLDAAIRQHKAHLNATFRATVMDEVKKRIDEMILPHWKEKIDEAQKLYKHRRGAMDKETFNTIRRGLHPDSRNSISDKKLGEAFDTFMSLEKFLLKEEDSPTDLSGLPRTWQEWEEAKRKTSEARKARRAAGKDGLARR